MYEVFGGNVTVRFRTQPDDVGGIFAEQFSTHARQVEVGEVPGRAEPHAVVEDRSDVVSGDDDN